MLDCLIQLVAGEGWQSGSSCFSSPRSIQYELLGAGFGQATLADRQASACLPCSAGAEMRRGFLFFGFVARTSKSSGDHCTGVSSCGCQCLNCGKCKWHLSRCEHESSVSSWLSELTCHVRSEAFPSSCLCLSDWFSNQITPFAALSAFPALPFACIRTTQFRPCLLLGMSFMWLGRTSP